MQALLATMRIALEHAKKHIIAPVERMANKCQPHENGFGLHFLGGDISDVVGVLEFMQEQCERRTAVINRAAGLMYEGNANA
jgi:hypothetical protein